MITAMTKEELKQKLTIAISELYHLQIVLEYAIRTGVPPDTMHWVQLNTVTKQLCSILTKLDMLEPDALQESA
jgi:hypothetical protein